MVRFIHAIEDGTITRMKTYLYVIAILFLLITLAHLLRFICGTTVIFGDWQLPMWTSIFGVIIAGIFSFLGFRYARRCH